MKDRFIMIICLLLPLLILTSCIKPKTTSLSGTVLLENDTGDANLDPVDHAGVTIALYQPAQLDTTLTRINNEYPTTGVLISQETEFDHRLATPLKTALSGADGSFSLPELEAGRYNLALFKEGWGVRYLYEIEVTTGVNAELGSITLYPEQVFPAYVPENTVLKADHSYLIQETTTFIGSVTIEPRAQIFVQPGNSLKFYGEVITANSNDATEFWKCLPASGRYSTELVEFGYEHYFSTLVFYSTQVNLSSGNLRYGSTGITTDSDASNISNLIVRHCGTAVTINHGAATLSNLLITDCGAHGVMSNSHMDEQDLVVDVSLSVFNNINSVGITIYIVGTYNVSNSYFRNCGAGAMGKFCNGTITHCSFELNTADIGTQGPHTHAEIHYNNFFHSENFTIAPQGDMIVLHNNNFYHTDYYYMWIWTAQPPYYSYTLADVDATNNYWLYQDLDSYLMDAVDNPTHPNEPCPYYIRYQPRKSFPVANAGIQ